MNVYKFNFEPASGGIVNKRDVKYQNTVKIKILRNISALKAVRMKT